MSLWRERLEESYITGFRGVMRETTFVTGVVGETFAARPVMRRVD